LFLFFLRGKDCVPPLSVVVEYSPQKTALTARGVHFVSSTGAGGPFSLPRTLLPGRGKVASNPPFGFIEVVGLSPFPPSSSDE